MGTDENMCIPADIDLTGIWWMSALSHKIGDEVQKGEGNSAPEYLVSFAGAVASSTTSYPLEMTAPTNTIGQWTWGDTFMGGVLMHYYATFNKVSDHQHFFFKNNSFAEVRVVAAAIDTNGDGSGMAFQKASADEWLRKNYDSTKGETPEDAKFLYKFVRIVYQDGTPSPFYQQYLDYMGNSANFVGGSMKTMRTWGTNNNCMRQCQGWMGPCEYCKWYCDA